MTTSHINTIEAKEQFADLINRVAHNKERIILTRRGKDIAALVSIEDLKLIQSSEDKHILQEATESLKETREFGPYTLEQLKNEVDI